MIVPFTVSALLLAGFLTGVVVVEAVFAWPGLGRLAVEAVTNNNLNLVVGTTLVFAVLFLIINFLILSFSSWSFSKIYPKLDIKLILLINPYYSLSF